MYHYVRDTTGQAVYLRQNNTLTVELIFPSSWFFDEQHMSNNKLSKYLHKHYTERKGNKTHTPVVLTDSKGKWLEKKISQLIEKEDKWWAKSSQTCKEGYNWLKSNQN